MLQVDIYEINGYSLMCKKEVWKGFSESMHKYFHIMKDLAEESNVEPFRRIETFSNFVNRFNNNPTISKDEFERGESKKNLDLFIKESQLPNPVVHHPVLSRNFCDIRSNIYTDILDEYTKKRTSFFLIIIPQNNAEVYKGRSVSIKLKHHIIDKLGLASWGLSQDIYKGVSMRLRTKCNIDIFRTKDYSYGSYSSNPVSKWYL
ncbi:hypothetical protein ACTFIZ_002930 [Dictyostelium cf. discoideum]